MNKKCPVCHQPLITIIEVPDHFWDWEKSKWIKKIEVPKEIRDAEEGSC